MQKIITNNQRLSDEDFLIEFDNLVNTALNRKTFNIPEIGRAFKNELNQNSLEPHSSLSSCSSISSINSYRPYDYGSNTATSMNFEKKKLNYTEREISLNNSSYYNVNKENFDYNLTSKHVQVNSSNAYSSFRNKTNTLRKNSNFPLTSQFEPKKKETYSTSPKLRKNDKIKTSSTRTSLISQPPELMFQKSTNLDDTELDVSEVCQFSEAECIHDLNKVNMCSSLIQESNSDSSSQSRKKKRMVLAKQPRKNSKSSNLALNMGFLPSLLNDLILILVKYLNKTNSIKSCRKNNQTNKIDMKYVKLMKKKVRIATLFNFITRLLMESNSKKKSAKFSLERSLFTILAETTNERPTRIKKRSKIYSTSMSSMSNDSSSTTSDSSIYMDKIDTSFDENPNHTDQLNELSSDDQNEQKWQAQLEIPNIEDPALFIDTLYNQLLANNETDIPTKQDECQNLPMDLNSLCSDEPMSDTNSSCSEDNNHFEIESSITKQDLTLNDDVSNNDLSLIDYSYLIANHTLERSDLKVDVNNTKELVVKDYVSLNPNIVDWNYEDETADDYNDVSINSIELEKPDVIQEHDTERSNHYPCKRDLENEKEIIEQVKGPDNMPSINTEFLKETRPFPTSFLISPSLSLTSPSLSISSLSTTKSSFSSNFRDNIIKSRISFGRDLFSASSLAKTNDTNDLSIASSDSSTQDDLKLLMRTDPFFNSPRSFSQSSSVNQISPTANGLLMKDVQNSPISTIYDTGTQEESPPPSTWFGSFVKSVKYIVMSKNVVLLPIVIFLLNSKFKNYTSTTTMSSNIINGVAKTTASAALATLNAMAKK